MASQVYITRRSLILANSEINEKFYSEIDMETTLPVFYYPIMESRSFKVHSTYETADIVAVAMVSLS